MGKEGKDDEGDADRACNDEIEAGQIGKIEGVSYCFHPNSPLGLSTIITK